jgi:hypothetical protein
LHPLEDDLPFRSAVPSHGRLSLVLVASSHSAGITMGLSKTIHKLFSGAEEDATASNTTYHQKIRQPRARSQSAIQRSRNKSRSCERTPAYAPYDFIPALSQYAEMIDSQITTASLSQIMIWYTYYDTVRVPGNGSRWFHDLPCELMFGWIRLGYELRYGGPGHSNPVASKGLQMACDEMGIDAREVVKRLVRLSDWASMLKSELESKEPYEDIVEKLETDRQLVQSLRPIPGSRFELWQQEILDRIQDYLQIIFFPVTKIGDFELPAADSMAETDRRNATRARFQHVASMRRDPPPEDFYVQAHDMARGKHVSFLNARNRSPSMEILPSEERERGCSRPCHAGIHSAHVRRNSAPSLDRLDMQIERLKLVQEEMQKTIWEMQQDRDNSLEQRTGLVMPQTRASRLQDLNHSNCGYACTRNGHERSPSGQADNRGRRPSRGAYSKCCARPTREYSSICFPRNHHNSSPQGLSSQSWAGGVATHGQLQTCFPNAMDLELPSLYPSQQQRNPDESPPIINNSAFEPLREPQNGHHRRQGRTPRVNNSHPPISSIGLPSSGSSIVTNPYANYDANSYPFNQNSGRNRHEGETSHTPENQPQVGQPLDEIDAMEGEDPDCTDGDEHGGFPNVDCSLPLSMISRNPSTVTLRYFGRSELNSRHYMTDRSPSMHSESTVYHTALSSPNLSMLNLRTPRMPGAWYTGSEAGSSRLGFAANSTIMGLPQGRHNPARSPSLATASVRSDVADREEVRRAVINRTRQALESAALVNLSSLSKRSPGGEEYRIEDEDQDLK